MKPGTKVEVVGSKCMPEGDGRFIGMRGVVVENAPEVEIIRILTGYKHGHELVSIDLGNRMCLICCVSAVRPIEDDDKPATWDGIEQLTGWKRPAVPA